MSGFKSRAGYNGACTVLKFDAEQEISWYLGQFWKMKVCSINRNFQYVYVIYFVCMTNIAINIFLQSLNRY